MKIKIQKLKYIKNKYKKKVLINRKKTINYLYNKKKFIVIIGPCSVHNKYTILKYSIKLKKLTKKIKNIFIILRFFIEKPRTTIGWKGYLYDPDVDNTYNINKGIKNTILILKKIVLLNLPIAMEFLNIYFYKYISNFVTVGFIGARNSESQIYREIVSNINCPFGFKNNTSGDILPAINSIIASKEKHNLLEIKKNGVFYIKSNGNKNCFLVLRGNGKPNYYKKNILNSIKICKNNNINCNIIIDCSHGNSQKNYKKQKKISIYLVKKYIKKEIEISGIMIESFLKNGSQKISKHIDPSISITDGCLSFNKSKKLLIKINNFLKKRI
ncbi:3-deoxy-7-phosphoheptulonate synthase [Candidatus Vidania fulgoroideorum]